MTVALAPAAKSSVSERSVVQRKLGSSWKPTHIRGAALAAAGTRAAAITATSKTRRNMCTLIDSLRRRSSCLLAPTAAATLARARDDFVKAAAGESCNARQRDCQTEARQCSPDSEPGRVRVVHQIHPPRGPDRVQPLVEREAREPREQRPGAERPRL